MWIEREDGKLPDIDAATIVETLGLQEGDALRVADGNDPSDTPDAPPLEYSVARLEETLGEMPRLNKNELIVH